MRRMVCWPCSFILTCRENESCIGERHRKRVAVFDRTEKKLAVELDVLRLIKNIRDIEDNVSKLKQNKFDEFCLKFQENRVVNMNEEDEMLEEQSLTLPILDDVEIGQQEAVLAKHQYSHQVISNMSLPPDIKKKIALRSKDANIMSNPGKSHSYKYSINNIGSREMSLKGSRKSME